MSKSPEDSGHLEVSPACHPLAVGNPGDARPSPEQISTVVSILIEAGICCCFVEEWALYFGTSRLPNSHSDILEPCGPLPLRAPDSLNHKYPRFKPIGRTDFWLLLPASYCHIVCVPENLEWSKGNLPYPKLQVYVQSLIDTKNLGDLEDLVDGMDLSEEWGEQNLSLEGHADSNWSENCIEALIADGTEEMFIFIDPSPTPQREIWQKCVRNKQRRLGWKYSPEIYATRYRRHGSKDPRERYRYAM
ncbi:hypothetical protein MGYG_06319 [Nannizzia gypsea CBS 118893]|uniref:Uncharacterized protein n=1 Tax=Arthroderma gypseum (strain ATCC MYA-4604 / CBS 118893) TaxID=535722 RepID=E4UYZ2_ARTGP|nr:hypothetical protein MGYG_06319 [Nannizzia gypsea CBS 118893]EFR03322.1 hypothetical protein MGYG_06319 [Nannizzia gypsea CBS 118893]